MNNLTSAAANAQVLIEPVVIPTRTLGRKDDLLPIRVNTEVKAYLEAELSKLGLRTARERQDFYRGAILAGISNAKRANTPQWQKFVAAIQPVAREHLGMGLDLDGSKEIMEAGSES